MLSLLKLNDALAGHIRSALYAEFGERTEKSAAISLPSHPRKVMFKIKHRESLTELEVLMVDRALSSYGGGRLYPKWAEYVTKFRNTRIFAEIGD